jgi:hypothetical protein
MSESAVLTTAMSSMSMAVAAQTTASVQRWVRIGELRSTYEKGDGEALGLPVPLTHQGAPYSRPTARTSARTS